MKRSIRRYQTLLGLVVAERLLELGLSFRNARKAFSEGAVETGRSHFKVMAGVQTAFLACCLLEPQLCRTRARRGLGSIALGGVLAAQALRYWAVTTLGRRWNVRVIVVPGAMPVTSGPYRYVRHPNYVAVMLETLCLPLVHGAYRTAALFSVAMAALLAVRIQTEEQALGALYQEAFAKKHRFFPGKAMA